MSHVLVVGDLILDRTWVTQYRRNPEAPAPCVEFGSESFALGGAANVAATIRATGHPVTLAGAVGRDAEGMALLHLIRDAGIRPNLGLQNQTTVKLRVVAHEAQVCRVDRDGWASDDLELNLSGDYDALVLSDYGKGVLTDPARVEALIAGMQGKPIIVDPKRGDYRRWSGATVLTPNEAEFAAAGGEGNGWRAWGVDAVLVTLGAAGMLLHTHDAEPVLIPGIPTREMDPCGAGDTVTAWLAAGLCDGLPLLQAAEQANRAAAIAVARAGTAVIGREDFEEGVAA